jgi:hypothetical protein
VNEWMTMLARIAYDAWWLYISQASDPVIGALAPIETLGVRG